MPQALEGIKVLEIAALGPVSYCTMFLGDLGAEVIKVEAPPELGRLRASPQASEEGIKAAAYDALNRNKKSIVINLRTEEGKEIFHRFAKTADVVVEGYRPGVVKRLGIDYDAISRLNPRIVYCSMSGYGQEGPYHELAGHDINYIAIGGALGLIGEKNGPPIIPLNLVGDFAGASLHAVIGIMAALLARDTTKKGQWVDISYIDGVLSLMTGLSRDYFRDGNIPQRGDLMLNGGYPFYNIYQTKDGGWVTIGCLEPYFWENLCRELGREDLIPHQWDKEKREEVFSFLRDAFRKKTRDEWFAQLGPKNIPVGKVYSLDEVFRDPQVVHRQMVTEVPHPTLGKVKQVGTAIKLSQTPGGMRFTAPLLGQHTEEILISLGYTRPKIAELRQKKVVK